MRNWRAGLGLWLCQRYDIVKLLESSVKCDDRTFCPTFCNFADWRDLVNPNIAALLVRMRVLEDELEMELAKRRAELHFTLHEKTVKFEKLVQREHLKLKPGLLRYIMDSHPLIVLVAPVIYAVVIPLVLLDLSFTLYQTICFPIYGIRKVRRSDYLLYDRNHLAYLNLIEKLNCAYCAYGNGIIAYAREIAALTEQYWCPIKHARRVLAGHAHYPNFVDYGDANAYRAELEKLRTALQDKQPD